jgi:NAD-dependent deacetylase
MEGSKLWQAEPAWSRAKALIANARKVVVLTGAGISAESGIPTFRDKQTGFWENHSIEQLATPEGFHKDMALVWGWYTWRRKQLALAKPNRGHHALAALADGCEELLVVTQNVDDLHEQAGSRAVLHLHGQLNRNRCFNCNEPQAFTRDDRDEINAIDLDGLHQCTAPLLTPPSCTRCGGYLRPDVVWFGESLPVDEWTAAEAAIRRCDLVLCVGTSGMVYPAAALPATARKAGVAVIQVNPQETALDDMANVNLRGTGGEVLPELIGSRKTLTPLPAQDNCN